MLRHACTKKHAVVLSLGVFPSHNFQNMAAAAPPAAAPPVRVVAANGQRNDMGQDEVAVQVRILFCSFLEQLCTHTHAYIYTPTYAYISHTYPLIKHAQYGITFVLHAR